MALNTKPLWEWVNERHAIYIRKWIREGGFEDNHFPWPHAPADADLEEADPDHYAMDESGPLTADATLRQYRFCNVFRELDRVTVWIRENIREPYADHPDLWFMLAIARTINWPPTLLWLMQQADECGPNRGSWPTNPSFSPEALADALNEYKDTGHKVYTGAYMIRAESNPNAEWYAWTKQEYVAKIVLGRLWEDREEWSAFNWNRTKGTDDAPNLQSVWKWFQQPRYIGWGPFMAYQAVVDMRWTRLLGNADDINTWAALGPGSRRGLNRLAGRPLDHPLKQADGLAEMRGIWEEQDTYRAPWVPRIDLSDIQNALCETDKWLRVRNGEGKPRAQYIPGRGY